MVLTRGQTKERCLGRCWAYVLAGEGHKKAAGREPEQQNRARRHGLGWDDAFPAFHPFGGAARAGGCFWSAWRRSHMHKLPPAQTARTTRAALGRRTAHWPWRDAVIVVARPPCARKPRLAWGGRLGL